MKKLLTHPADEPLAITLVPHADVVPLAVMVRGTLEWLLDHDALELLLQQQAPQQYTRELTLQALVRLVIQVAAGMQPSVHAAYQADQALDEPTITTTYQAVYGKLARLQPAVSAAVVRHSAQQCDRLLTLMPNARQQPRPGYRLRALDGNVLAGSEHHLTPLRRWLNACLPGKSLVVYEPGSGLVTDVVLCEDAYTQERALLTQILPRVRKYDLFLADRNFGTRRFVFGIDAAGAALIVRQPARNLPCQALTSLRHRGSTASGEVYEQLVQATDPESGRTLTLRRIEVRLKQKTRDGEATIALLTNLPESISAVEIAEEYRRRWTIETHLQFLTQSLQCELPSLGQPRAALFGFAMALLAANALAVVRGGLRSAQGVEAEQEVSGYYLAKELSQDDGVLMKHVPAEHWQPWQAMPAVRLAALLCELASRVRLKGLTRSRRGPKKPRQPKPVYNPQRKHYSTARLLKDLEQLDSC